MSTVQAISGACTQLIKAALLSQALRTAAGEASAHTGQHHDRSRSAVIFKKVASFGTRLQFRRWKF